MRVGSAFIIVNGFVAPNMIIHYVVDHSYRPPDAFIDAVLRVVVNEPPPRFLPTNPFSAANTIEETRGIKIVDLAISVRCRLTLSNMGADTVGDLLDAGRQSALEHVGDSSACAEELTELFSEHNVSW